MRISAALLPWNWKLAQTRARHLSLFQMHVAAATNKATSNNPKSTRTPRRAYGVRAWGVPRDFIEATKWYRLAADQGYAGARNNFGTLTSRLIFGDDAPERQRNSQRNLIEGRTIYWMITAERPKL